MLFSASDSGGSSRFAPDTWYGQAVLAADTVSGRRSAISLLRRAMGRRLGHANPAAIPVDALTLPDLLAHFAQVDLIDLDLQGSELAVLASSLDGLTEKVARIHIRDPQPADRSGPPAGAFRPGVDMLGGLRLRHVRRDLVRPRNVRGWCAKLAESDPTPGAVGAVAEPIPARRRLGPAHRPA